MLASAIDNVTNKNFLKLDFLAVFVGFYRMVHYMLSTILWAGLSYTHVLELLFLRQLSVLSFLVVTMSVLSWFRVQVLVSSLSSVFRAFLGLSFRSYLLFLILWSFSRPLLGR